MWGGQGASEETIAAEITPLPDDPQPLADEEIAERERCAAASHAPCCVQSLHHACAPPARAWEGAFGHAEQRREAVGEPRRLLDEGFASWNKRDFTAFTRAAEKFGRHALTEIARDIDGKTEDEVCIAPFPPRPHHPQSSCASATAPLPDGSRNGPVCASAGSQRSPDGALPGGGASQALCALVRASRRNPPQVHGAVAPPHPGPARRSSGCEEHSNEAAAAEFQGPVSGRTTAFLRSDLCKGERVQVGAGR